MFERIHPVLPFVAAIAAVPFLGLHGRRVVSLLAPAAALVLVLAWPEGASISLHTLGHQWTVLRVDPLGRIFAIAFTLYSLLAGIFAWREVDQGAKAASLGLAGSAVGLVLAGDLLSLLLFWEMLAVCSWFLIWCGRSPHSSAAGYRYALFHITGGLCLLAGIVLQLDRPAELALNTLPLSNLSAWLILLGVAANAAIPPLHAWLPDAYPRASVFGSVFLAAFTTKSAVYVLARLFPAVDLLVWLGAAMALYGVVFAVLENDIRRLLAYHIISQVGYMVCGVGLGTTTAINGAAAHAFCHIFYKGLLMMAAGAVIYATGHSKLTELGRLNRSLRWTLVLMMIGAFSISGVPLFNGFVSKSIVVSAAAEAHRGTIELLLLVASMGTFLHTGLKLPWFTFFGSKTDPTPVRQPVPRSMLLAMWLTAAVCTLTGIWPGLLYAALPYPLDYHPYTPDHVLTALQLLLGTAMGFWLLRGALGGQPTITFDVDRLYRRPLAIGVDLAGRSLQAAFAAVEQIPKALAPALRQLWIGYQTATMRATLGHRAALLFLTLAVLWYLVRYTR